MTNKQQITNLIKNKASELGFNAVGIAKPQALQDFKLQLNKWLKKNYHADMLYMENNKEKRINPKLLVSETKSIISLLISYYPKQKQPNNIPQIAKYAYGVDYHFVIKEKMNILWDYIKTINPQLQGRIFVDSAPISDKAWAVKAGLGWIGKNACLINKNIGSFFFIAELLVNIELEYSKPFETNHCGNCTKCIDICPTKAIVKPQTIDSRRCISYLTIENKKNDIDNEFANKINLQLFGCDLCQDVCPWNKKPIITSEKAFEPIDFIKTATIDDWEKLDKQEFNKIFKKSPLKRAKYEGIQRNLKVLKNKDGIT